MPDAGFGARTFIMQIFLSNLFLLAKRLLFLLGLYTLCRLYFIAFHFNVLMPLDPAQFVLILANGFRFDISALFFTNAIFVILHLFPWRFVNGEIYQFATRMLMIVFNFGWISLNIIDAGYFSFQNSRSSADFVANILFSQDTVSLLPQYLLDYWQHTIASFILFSSLWYFMPRYRELALKTPLKSRLQTILAVLFTSLFIIAICIAGIRGVSAKPLRIVDAASSTSAKVAPFVLNTTFTVIKTYGKSGVTLAEYYAENEARQIFSADRKSIASHVSMKKNLVVLIMESMSSEIVGELNGSLPSYTPFLDSLIRSGLVFENAFSNGRTSIQSVPSVCVSLPQLMDVSLITSQYAANNVNSLASLLKNNGYATSFFHGAFNGSMGFDKYCSAIGYDRYYGQDEYVAEHPDQSAVCSWGVFDDAFLSFAADKMNTEPEPFFTTLFTISAHHPYELPAKYSHIADTLTSDLASVIYADYSLRLFFEKITRTDWYPNTIFVLVADHTAPYKIQKSLPDALVDSSKFDLAKVRIPLLIYDPSNDSLRGRSSRVVQQLDILPSMLHLLGVSCDYISYGNDFFDPRSTQFSFSYNQGIYTYIDSLQIIQFDGTQLLQSTNWRQNSNVPAGEAENKLRFIKAYIQDYTQRMVYNQLTPAR